MPKKNNLPAAKKGDRIELLENLPHTDFPLVTAGLIGTVSVVAGKLFSRSKTYQLVFDLGGPNTPLVVLRDVVRSQFRTTKPDK